MMGLTKPTRLMHFCTMNTNAKKMGEPYAKMLRNNVSAQSERERARRGDAQVCRIPTSGGEDPVAVAESDDDRADEADPGGVGLAP